ncbi:MAG: zinc ribbon domain-containing protein [Pontibacterium sp.]
MGKCEDAEKNLQMIGRLEPSTTRCNHCGDKMAKMPLSVRRWDFPSCDTQGICRDTSAARNIRDIGFT